MITNDTYDANVRVRELPRIVDHKLNMIAAATGQLKWEIVRRALCEYVDRHYIEFGTRL